MNEDTNEWMSWKDLFMVLPIKVSGKEDNKIQ